MNKKSPYIVPNASDVSLLRYRYADSALPNSRTETGFIVKGQTEILDTRTRIANELRFVWTGGKGLADSKLATLNFVNPDTQEVSSVIADLRRNTLTVPDSVRDLFPRTKFYDNGYGYALEVGLNGGDPRQSFQPWSVNRAVAKWQDHIARQGEPEPFLINRGVSLRELAGTD